LPEELAIRAAELGYGALALTDHDGVYGSLEFAQAAKAFGVRPITGAEVTLSDGSHVTLLVESAMGYANLCRLLTAAHSATRVPGKERELLEPGAPAGAGGRAQRGTRLPVGLRPARSCGAEPERGGAAGEGVRPRPLFRRAPAALRAWRRSP
jgi:hypothetical protein